MLRIVAGAIRAHSFTSRGSLSITARCAFATSTMLHNSASRLVKTLDKQPNDGLLNVTWDNGTISRYPFVYLRDICQCPECFHDSSKQRAFDSVAGLSSNLVASKVDVGMNGKQITLTWPNSHVTSFDSDWLFERRLPEAVEQQMKMGRIDDDIQLCDHQMTGNVPTLLFHEVLNNKSTQIRWLDMIHRYGITLIKDAPTEPGQVHKLGETLGFLKEMWFGTSQQTMTSFDEKKQIDPLIPQSPSTYNEYRGGLHLIHCQKQAEGSQGEHLFVDGFKIAQDLQDNDPEAFHLLCTSPIMYQRKGANKDTELDMKFSRPIIRLDSNGCLTSMVYSNTNRLTFSHATPDEIPMLYQAYYKLTSLIKDPRYIIRLRLQPGDIMSYDCDRVFSGRDAFGPDVKGTEIFEDAFTDKDMTLSRSRTLKASLETEVD